KKDTFVIVKTSKCAGYLVRRPTGFSLYTNHRSLRSIFCVHDHILGSLRTS
ncbi:hypothetical protein PHYSODRAFT_522468, partial [Phytophthora sojae]